jgi:hypothetical protein
VTTAALLTATSHVDDPGASAGVVVLVVAALALYWLASVATGRRRARVCDRYGHAPDPATVGTWRERCARCGARLR